MLQVESCAEQQNLIYNPVLEKGVCSDSNWIAQRLHMAVSKHLKIDYNQSLQLKQ